jgi:2-polyprenyl-3-methyl-5-hydroxy-6-metoxy-1,4-benzoquinol methylase
VNLKLLIPSYRTRQSWANDVLRDLGVRGRMLNVGTGEGDIDPILARYATELQSCDVNPDDIAHARAMNANVPNLVYSVQNGEALSFESASFDVVTCFEVIEHVGDARKLMSELARVLKPGGALVLSCPSVHFPIAYDPINAALSGLGTHFPIGAYAYGHSWLVDAKELEGWASENSLEIEKRFKLSGWLVGATECYWPGVVQRLLKANTSNTAGKSGRGVRPSGDAPPLVGVVDALIAVDRAVSSFSSRSVGLGYVMRKPG